MAATNVQAFSGDVEISSNLAVNTNTLFVDTESGRVGIGATNPTHTLHVRRSGGASIGVESTGGFGSLEIGGASGGYIDFKTPFSDDYDSRIMYNGDDLQFTGSNFSFDTNTLFVDTVGNKVGIGEATPDYKLHVVGGDIAISGGTSNYDSSIRGGYGNRMKINFDLDPDTSDCDRMTISLHGDECVRIRRNYNSVVNSTLFFGNVGIGTTNPGTELEVNGDIGIARTAGGYTFREQLGGNIRAGIHSTSSNELSLRVGGNSEAIRIDGSGNVGIGKADPGSVLDVNGTVTATTFSGELDGNAGSSTNVRVDRDDTGDTTMYLTMVNNSTAGNSKRLYMDNGLVYDNTNNRLSLNSMVIADYIYHSGDANTYFGFDGNDSFRIVENSSIALEVNSDSTIDIQSYIKHAGDSDSYFGFYGGGQWRLTCDNIEQIRLDSSDRLLGRGGRLSKRTWVLRDGASAVNDLGGYGELIVGQTQYGATGSFESPLFQNTIAGNIERNDGEDLFSANRVIIGFRGSAYNRGLTASTTNIQAYATNYQSNGTAISLNFNDGGFDRGFMTGYIGPIAMTTNDVPGVALKNNQNGWAFRVQAIWFEYVYL